MKVAVGATGRPLIFGTDQAGLCSVGRKCVRKDGHDGACWPQDEEGAESDD